MRSHSATCHPAEWHSSRSWYSIRRPWKDARLRRPSWLVYPPADSDICHNRPRLMFCIAMQSSNQARRLSINVSATSLGRSNYTACSKTRPGFHIPKIIIITWFLTELFKKKKNFSFLNSVASLLISRAMTEKSASYFNDSPYWFSDTMLSYYVTVLWSRMSRVHSNLIFVLFVLRSVIVIKLI